MSRKRISSDQRLHQQQDIGGLRGQKSTATSNRMVSVNWQPKKCMLLASVVLVAYSLAFIVSSQQQLESEKVTQVQNSDPSVTILPPPQARPNVNIDLTQWTKRLSDEIHVLGNKINCLNRIERIYSNESELFTLDAVKMRDTISAHIQSLLNQHRQAVSSIVADAEHLAMNHPFNKNLRFNYTDVHRLRNELDPVDPNAQLADNWGTSSSGGLSSGSTGSSSGGGSQGSQFTSINGGTPVPGPVEWQTPIRSLIMQVHENFGDIPVNLSQSAVHLPLPIYAGLPDIMNGIAWTENLDRTFRTNLEQFAHIHHQMYGDHLGFLRTFPAHKWRIARSDPDLFDARVRPWYVTGASLPKDVVILVDTSGSMTGLRREIAKGVVFEILDTLTIDDHFAVLRFSESVTPVGLPKCNLRTPKMGPKLEEYCKKIYNQDHECEIYRQNWESRGQYLRDNPNLVLGKNGSYLTDELYRKSIANLTNEIQDAYLLPATSRNIRYLKSNFTMPTAGIANFTNALMAAFELLQAYNRSVDLGSHCNQAIMLITDGAIQSHEDIFNRYNYPNLQTRVFTYMIGREVGDITATKAMACNNRGYYTHVINLGEVREQVQKYLPVMARPLVLSNQHKVSWTHVYGDETYQVLTDWVLELKRRERARIMLNEERERISPDDVVIEMTNIPEYDEISLGDQLKNRLICEDTGEDPVATDQSLQEELDPLGYNDPPCHWTTRRADLLISVVKPVFDSRNSSLLFERVLHKNIWTERETHVRNAQLLGIASVDLRVSDIMHFAPSHLLGPNAYAILVGQNGFVLHHPDFRALLEDPFDKQSKILKPHFASVDLTHIEQVLTDSLKRRNEEPKLVKLRENILHRKQSGSETFYVKRAIDCRRRLQIKQQSFYYTPIKDSPYSLLIALPQNYGLNRLNAKRRLTTESANFFLPSSFDLWSLHPDYKYCEGSKLSKNSSAKAVLEVLEKARDPDFKLKLDDLTSLGPSGNPANKRHKPDMVCDSELFPSLLFDAAATYDRFCGQTQSSSDSTCESGANPFSNFYGSLGSSEESCSSSLDDMRSKLANIHGLEMSFVATRSGLTRVRVFDLTARIKKLADLFIQRHNRGVDEPWYSRTVDWNMRFDEDATIITAPYNGYIRLVAKLRQRLTQRHKPENQTRANCDPQLVTDQEELESNFTSSNSSSSPSIEGQNDTNTSSSTKRDSPADALPNEDPTAGHGDSDTNLSPEERVHIENYSSFELLDLVANSSVHISATQSVLVTKGSRQRSAAAVGGLLYDYSTFARRFLNATTFVVNITPKPNQDESPVKVRLCGDGECPSKCGDRSDTIDCLLVDNNGFIVVAEELAHVGRPLVDYDEKLMQSLVDKRLFHQVNIIDYQAICSRPAAEVSPISQMTGTSGAAANGIAQISSPSTSTYDLSYIPIQVSRSFLLNLLAIGNYVWSSFLATMIFQSASNDLNWLSNDLDGDRLVSPYDKLVNIQSRGIAAAQLSVANQSLLAILPNKTFLRPCEKQITYYETRPTDQVKMSSSSPEYYVTRCACSGWYVHEPVPKTNLIMLLVNTTAECRRCSQSSGSPNQVSNFVPVVVNGVTAQNEQPATTGNKSLEEQVCNMLERDAQLFVRRVENCISHHPEESQIHICGSAFRHIPQTVTLIITLTIATLLARRLDNVV